jgi:two-component system NtrC family sensor kinase
MEKILRNIIEGVSNNYGKAFFDTITIKLHESIGADFTFIARLDLDASVSRTVSLVAAGKVVDNMEYSLEHTPCADVAGNNVCLYKDSITHLFPKDQMLVDMGIVGYVGTPLHDSDGSVLGLIVALYKNPIKDIDFVKTIFQLFSGRIAGEIERTEYQRDLESKVAKRTAHLEEALQSLKCTQILLVRQEKLASLGGVVAGIAHEINTPLGIAKTGHSLNVDQTKKITKSFNDNTLTASAMKQYLSQSTAVMSTVTDNLERAIDLVQNFKYAAVDRIDDSVHSHNLNQLVTRVTTSLAAEFLRSQIKCSINIDINMEITTHGSDLTQVISNLIMNAAVHAFEGRVDRNVEVSAVEQKDGYELFVTDNGCGVDKRIRANVFDPFVTTKRGQGSTGLGMNIIHKQVTGSLNGQIELICPLSGGTQWKISLPKKLNLPEQDV